MAEKLCQLKKKGGSNVSSFLEPLQFCAWSGQAQCFIGNLTVGSGTPLNMTSRAISCVANVTGFNGTLKYTYTGSWQDRCFGLKEGVITTLGSKSSGDINITNYDYIIIMIATTNTVSNVVITLTST